MDNANPVDAGGTQPSEAAPEANPQTKTEGPDYWKTEAHRAFEKRDEARAKYKELEAKYNTLSASKADASDAVTARLAELTAERDGLQTKLAETNAAHRESQILSKLAAGTPTESRGNLELLYRKFADQLDDGEAAPGEVAEKAEAFLKQLSPTLFQTTNAPERGRLAPNGGKPEFSAEAERKKISQGIRQLNPGATGVSL